MATNTHKKSNHITNLVIFVRKYLLRIILPFNQLDVRINTTYIKADAGLLISKEARLAQTENLHWAHPLV